MLASSFDLSGQITTDLEKYLDSSASYIIALETCAAHSETHGQPYHILADMNQQQYDKFRKTILVNKMHLSGQARNGIGRQYGRIKNIRDETKLMSYTLKNNNIIYKNIDLKTIQESYEKSYIRSKSKDFVQGCMEFLLTIDHMNMQEGLNPSVASIDYTSIEKSIVTYYSDETIGKPVSRSALKSLTTRYLMYYHPHNNAENTYTYLYW